MRPAHLLDSLDSKGMRAYLQAAWSKSPRSEASVTSVLCSVRAVSATVTFLSWKTVGAAPHS